MTDFLVRRDDPKTVSFIPTERAPLEDGEVELAIDRFAFTANNVTYAAFGDRMSYWNFFPAPEGFGRIPVWGYGTVGRSRCEGVTEGERFYGYYPMSTHVVVRPERTNPAGFTDGAAHRAELHALYNAYTRTSTDPLYDAEREPQTLLLRPLFVTSFVIDDLLGDNAFFGADAIVLSSASSKTAWGVAFLLAQRKVRGEACPEIVGLTSARNVAYVTSLGFYDRVVIYDALATLPADWKIVYVDLAGDFDLRRAVHEHFGDGVRYSSAVGFSHNVQRARDEKPLPGAEPKLFFAPDQIRKRSSDWGPGGFPQRFAAAWHAVIVPASDPAKKWLTIEEQSGNDAVERVYREAVAGTIRPEIGYILKLS